MSQYVNEQVARAAKDSGLHIGGIEPCGEMKWTGWAVYATGQDIIACVIGTDGTVHCGERINATELYLYLEDPAKAMTTLATEKVRPTTPSAANKEVNG